MPSSLITIICRYCSMRQKSHRFLVANARLRHAVLNDSLGLTDLTDGDKVRYGDVTDIR